MFVREAKYLLDVFAGQPQIKPLFSRKWDYFENFQTYWIKLPSNQLIIDFIDSQYR